MARHRHHAPEFIRLFEATSEPIYALDEDFTIVFMNQSCRDWLGLGDEGLIGTRCTYRTSPEVTGAAAIAAHLCPPPTVMRGREIRADVARLTEQGPIYRRATFVPLAASPQHVITVVALLGSQDFSEPSPPDSIDQEKESIDLHEHVRRFRRQSGNRYRLQKLVGSVPAMRRARAQAELAAGTEASVLLIGPQGIGRRHLAEAIHYSGPIEPAGPILAIDCPMLGPEVLRSTLSDLAAHHSSQAAARATLLLCEVDRLALDGQAILAAALATPFPLRLMATATRPLFEAVRHERFREDLAGILSTIVIELPSLGQRRSDLPLLAQALLEDANGRGAKQVVGFTVEAMDRLCAYTWPGQIAELAKAVAECHLRAAGAEITASELPQHLGLASQAAARPRRKEEAIELDEFLGRIERELIRRAMARSKGNKAKAARLLGLNRARLGRKMVQLGLLDEGRSDS